MNDFLNSKIEGSSIHPTVIIDSLSNVVDSILLDYAKVYKFCWVVKSTMKKNTFIGDGTKIDNSILEAFSRCGKNNHLFHVKLGKHTYTGQNTVIMHTNIGAFSSISWNVSIGGGEHDFSRLTSHSFLYNSYDRLNDDKVFYNRFEEKCTIGNDVWIGANSTILRGVQVGDGSVIGANSVVTKDIPPFAIAVGNPARIMKYRFTDDIIERLLNIKWWELDDDLIHSNCDLFASNVDHIVLNKIEKLTKY